MTKARDIASAIPAPATVSSVELGYLDGVTSAIQTQVDSKIGSASAINPTIVDAKGDIIAATAADAVSRLVVGANNTVLTADSATATGLKWAAAAAGGKVLQVVTATTTTQVDSSTTTDVDSNLTATITPSSTGSKVLILISQSYSKTATSSTTYMRFTLFRGATILTYPTSDLMNNSVAAIVNGILSVNYLDSPATTSATTYKTQIRSGAGTSLVSVQYNGNSTSQIVLMEIGA